MVSHLCVRMICESKILQEKWHTETAWQRPRKWLVLYLVQLVCVLYFIW